MSADDQARQAALDVLRAVRIEDAYANLALPQLLRERGIAGRDAAFATELAYGTLRWQGWYDAIIDTCVDRKADDIEHGVREVLRLGCRQLLGMRVPAHAAIDSSVNLARRNGNPGSARGRSGFVNAILRRVSERTVGEWVERLDVAGTDETSLSTRWSHPQWIVRAFAESLGARRDELADLLRADNESARPALVAVPGRMTEAELLERPGVEPARWSPIGGRLVSGAPEALPEIAAGRARVQDEGSQLVALALARAEVDGSESAWLDTCAGPGGKAAVLAGLAEQRDCQLVAVEHYPHRARLVEASLRGATNAQVLVGDSTARPWGDRVFDRVLVDAPCTGLGALRRRPEARWRKSPADLASLAPLQRALLNSALDVVRPGGVVAYVTCSPHLAETEFVVSDVRKRRSDVVVEDARALLPEVADCGDGPYVQLWPHRHQTDGMFLAILRRA